MFFTTITMNVYIFSLVLFHNTFFNKKIKHFAFLKKDVTQDIKNKQ